MQYIQLQPQIAPTVTLPAVGNLNLFLDNQDNLVKAVDSTGTVYGPTGTGVYITGGTYNANTGVTTLVDSVGGQIQIPGYFTTMNDVYVTGGTFSVATGTLTLVKNNNSIEPITGFTTFTGGTYDNTTGTLNLVKNGGLTEHINGFYTGTNALTGGTYNTSNGIATFTNISGTNIELSGISTPLITLSYSSLTDTLAINANDTLLIYYNDLLLSMQYNTLIPGQFYKITGVNTDLYGGTDIIVQALSTNEISKNGHGLFFNPKYNVYDIWSPYSTLEFNNLDGFFDVNEKITGDSGQTGTIVGLAGDYTISFITENGEFSAGTKITGYDSGATALTTNLTSKSYNVGDKVIWGGKVWKNVSGDSATITNKIVGVCDNNYFNFNLPIGVLRDTLVVTCDSEVLTGDNTTNYWNIQGSSGGYGHIDADGSVSGWFDANHDGLNVTVSYSVGINQRVDSWTLDAGWEVVPYDDVDYTPTWDIIEYEYEYDNISLRKDSSNEVSSAWAVTVNWWGWNSIKSMQWGGNINQLTAKNPGLDNLVNLNGNMFNVTIEEGGGIDCQNWIGGADIERIVIGNGGYLAFNTIGVDVSISNINIGVGSYIASITLANDDYNNMYFGDINLGNSAGDCGTYIENINVGAGSRFYGVNLDSSSSDLCTYITNVYLNNNSYFYNIKIEQGGWIDSISLYNNGYVNNLQIGQSAYIQYGYIYNSAQLSDIILEGSSSSYIYDFHIGQNSRMSNIKIGLQSFIDYIYLDNTGTASSNYFEYISLNNNSYIEDIYFNGGSSYFGNISLGVNSYINDISFSGNSYFEKNQIGDNSNISNVDLLNNNYFGKVVLSNYSYITYINFIDYAQFYQNSLGDRARITDINLGLNSDFYSNNLNVNAYINNITLGYQGGFYYNDLSVNANVEQITINDNADMGYFQIGLDAVVSNLVINENVYLGDITIGEYLYLTDATFTEDVAERIIDRNNNNFPATLYIDNALDLDLGPIYYAGEVALKTRQATIQYDNYNGTGFTIGDIVVDQVTNAQGVILSNITTSAIIVDEAAATGDGSQSAFTFTLANQRVQPYSVTISAYTNTLELLIDSRGDGTLFGNYGGTFGTINYATGLCDVSFTNPVSAGTSVYAYYNTATGGTMTVNVIDKSIQFGYGNDINNNNGSNAYVVSYTPPSSSTTISSIYNFPTMDYNGGGSGRNSLYNVTLLPESGLTVNFYGTPTEVIQNHEITMPSAMFAANGSVNDYMTIGSYRDANRGLNYIQQIDAQNYVTGSIRATPTLTGANVTSAGYQTVDIEAFISDAGSFGPITEKGFVWKRGYNNIPYLSDNKQAATGTTTGLFSLTVTGTNSTDWVTLRAYAINGAGVSYSNIQIVSPYICLAKGTLVTLADGSTKNIEDIDYSDELKVWNFDEGMFDVAKPTFISVAQPTNEYNLIKFSDGSELRTIQPHLGHRIFNIEAGAFTYPMTDDTPIGTSTFNDKGEIVTVVSKEIVNEENEFFNVITAKHLNVFCNTILTSCKLNNMYPIVDMKFVKEKNPYETPLEVLMGITEKEYVDLRLAEQRMEIGEIVDYVTRKNIFRK